MSTPPGGQPTWHAGRITLTSVTERQIQPRVEVPVLGAGPVQPTLPFSDFVPVELPISLEVAPAAPAAPGVLGATGAIEDEVALLTYQPDPAEDGAFLLLHEIETADGTIYDVSLPLPPLAAEAESGILGGAVPALRFPVRQLVNVSPRAAEGEGGVLGGIGETIVDAAGSVIFKQVLHMLRAPLVPALRQFVAEREGPALSYLVNPDGTMGQPLPDFQAWRAALTPGVPQRVLLFVHGFLSTAEASLPHTWMRDFAPHYDALIAYSHPTIATGPVQNAADLLAQIPDDLRLNADIVAHSRGGVVARSLIELLPSAEKLVPARLLSCGAPHAGTLLGQFQRWDRLASIALTAASWIMKATGVAAPLAFVPKLLEYLLRAGGQFFFDLPGVNALDPDSAFIQELNMPAAPGSLGTVPYAVVTSAFDALRIEQPSFRDALGQLAVKAFIGAPNDLIVHTPSMSSIDLPERHKLEAWTYAANVNHFAYFDHPDIQAFAGRFLTIDGGQ